MTTRLRALPARVVDVLLFVVVTGTVSVVVTADQATTRPPDLLPYLWAVGFGAPMLLRRQAPRLVLALTVLGFVTYYAAGFPALGVALPVAAALFSAAEARRPVSAAVTGAVLLLVSTGYRVAVGQSVAYVLGYDLVTNAAFMAAVILLGYSVRVRRDVRESAEQLALARARETALRAAATAGEERAALARDLHDSIGHSLSVASLFTDVARERHLPPGERGTADEPLVRVRLAVSDAMAHLRSTVALLRSGRPDEPAAPTLAELPVMLQAPALAGYDVSVDVDEDLHAPPDVEAAVYRVVQEAVTNTLRHSDATGIAVGPGVEGRGVPARRRRRRRHGGVDRPRPAVRERAARHAGTRRVRRRGRPRRPRRRRLPRPLAHPGRGDRVIRVLLVDDQSLVREGLRALLDAADDIEVVGEAADGRRALAAGRELRPDVVLMDLRMPGMSGIDAILAMRADPQLRTTPALVLTTFDDEADVTGAVRAGATGYLLKDTDSDDLRRAVRAAARGDASLAPSVARRMMDRVARLPDRHDADPRLRRLTQRELEVLAEVGRGLSNEEIGRALFLSPETARTYVSRLLGKLGARDRSQLVVLAHRWGLVAD
ncbi:MAG: response regulator [Kineosporiaceae bacterium]